MKLSVELYAEKPIFVKYNSFIKLSLRSHGLVFQETIGTDIYYISSFLLSGKRLGGLARQKEYNQPFSPGLHGIEAKPGAFAGIKETHLDKLDLIIETNLILDPGILRENTGIRLINEKGKKFDIPLKRPDVEVDWASKGKFIVNLTEFINSKLFSA